jgi:DNA-binding beta-propeller fold protein YncE
MTARQIVSVFALGVFALGACTSDEDLGNRGGEGVVHESPAPQRHDVAASTRAVATEVGEAGTPSGGSFPEDGRYELAGVLGATDPTTVSSMNAQSRRTGSLAGASLLLGSAFAAGQAFLPSTASAGIVKATVRTGASTYQSFFDPSPKKLYVISRGEASGSNWIDSHLTIVDAAGNVTQNDLKGCGAFDAVLNKTTHRLYVKSCGIKVIDTNTDQIITSITTTGSALYLNETANKIYALDPFASQNALTVIDGVTHATTFVDVGPRPKGAIVNPATDRVYVLQDPPASGNITVYNGATGTQSPLSLTTWGRTPQFRLVNPATNRIYVTFHAGGDIAVIDGNSGTVSSLSSGNSSYPSVMALRPSNGTLLIHSGWGSINVLNGSTHAIVGTLSTTSGSLDTLPSAIEFDEANNRIYVAQSLGPFPNGAIGNGLVVYDATTYGVISRHSTGGTSNGVLVDSANGLVYVTNHYVNNVTIIDTKLSPVSPSIVLPITQRPDLGAVAIDTINNKVYAGDYSADVVAKVDGVSGSVSQINVGGSARFLTFDAVSGKLFALIKTANGRSVKVIESNGSISATVPVDPGAALMAINESTGKLYVSNGGSASVTVMDRTSLATTTIPVGYGAETIAINKATNTAYVLNCIANSMSVVNGTTNAVVATIPNVGSSMCFQSFPKIEINEATNTIYVAMSQEVWKINGATNAASLIDSTSPPQSIGLAQLQVDSAHNKIYAMNQQGKLTIVDGATNAVSRIDLPIEQLFSVNSMQLDPTNRKLYIAYSHNSAVVAVDLISNGTATIGTSHGPSSLVRNPVTNTYYTVSSDNKLDVIRDIVGEWTYSAGGYTYAYAFFADRSYQASRSTACRRACVPVVDVQDGTYFLDKGRYVLLPAITGSRGSNLIVDGNLLRGTDFGASLVLQRVQ